MALFPELYVLRHFKEVKLFRDNWMQNFKECTLCLGQQTVLASIWQHIGLCPILLLKCAYRLNIWGNPEQLQYGK